MSRRKNLFVLTLMLWSVSGALGMAKDTTSSTMITLSRPVHFSAGDGGELVAAPGAYTVLAVENSRVLLIPEKEAVPLLIQAQTTSHKESIASPLVRSIPGEGDEHHILVFLPRGQALDAVGFYSDLSTRASATAPAKPAREKPTRRGPPPQAPVPSALKDPASPVPGSPGKPPEFPTPSPTPVPPPEETAPILSSMQNLNGRLASLEARLDTIERLLSAVESKLASQLDALDRKLEGLKQ
jgi:hypothetical protein